MSRSLWQEHNLSCQPGRHLSSPPKTEPPQFDYEEKAYKHPGVVNPLTQLMRVPYGHCALQVLEPRTTGHATEMELTDFMPSSSSGHFINISEKLHWVLYSTHKETCWLHKDWPDRNTTTSCRKPLQKFWLTTCCCHSNRICMIGNSTKETHSSNMMHSVQVRQRRVKIKSLASPAGD